MALYRTDIEKALDEMISNQEGMTFQGLAVVLAKQKWPELVASERHYDLGLDAYGSASCARDGIGKGLVCSTTATIEKIISDIEKFQQHYSDVKVLLFSTPRSVTNHTAEPWKERILKKFGIELQILSREEIITELMLPANLSMCQSHLGLSVSVEPTTQELIEKTREATAEDIATWLANRRLSDRPTINLQSTKLDDEGRDTREILNLEHLQRALKEGRRIVLEAPAGRGKTTTLAQLGDLLCKEGGVAFLIDLPGWVESGKSILEYIAQAPPFQSHKIQAQDLAQIYKAAHCSFLLNGWNEISGESSAKAARAFADLERNFPKAGIIVATRNHYIEPPLPGSFTARLLSFNRKQRAEYIRRTIGSRAGELISQLESDRALDKLTRTPLVLAEVTTLFLSDKPIPRTKAGVIKAVMRLFEESIEHRHHLACPPLQGQSHHYLLELAVQMTARDTVILEDAVARSAVTTVGRALISAGQIVAQPEPGGILNALCAHHILERIDYPSVAFKFQHQVFQEWHASLMLENRLLELVKKNDKNLNREFTRGYINEPRWEEPILMIAQNTGEQGGELSKAGKMLVELALDVDSIFAAELARLGGSGVWTEVREAVGERLRAWHNTDEDFNRKCAVVGMFASGSEDFKDILLPLLVNKDHQSRLRMYRLSRTFHLSSLGSTWNQTVSGWDEDQRADFISEVADEYSMAGVAEEFAKTDPSVKVRNAALRALDWSGAAEALGRVLNSYDDAAFEEVLRKNVIHEIPEEAWSRAVGVYNSLLQKTDEPRERLRIRLALVEIDRTNIIRGVKEDLSKWPSERIKDGEEMLIKKAVELVQKTDPDWVSQWVAERVAQGHLWREGWVDFISKVSEEFRKDLLNKIESEDFEHKDISSIISVLVATANEGMAGRIFSKLCLLEADDPKSRPKTNWEIIRQLQTLFRALPSEIAVSGMLRNVPVEPNPIQYEVVMDLFGQIGNEGPHLRTELTEKSRQELRQFLKKGLPFVLSHEDFNGELKAHLATALSRVGDPEDMADLHSLIRADDERVKKGSEAWRKGERSPSVDASRQSWRGWYVRAVEQLDSQSAEDLLLRIFSEQEYEEDISKALIRLARTGNLEGSEGFRRKNYQKIWDARAGQLENTFDETRRLRYVIAIKAKIAILQEEKSKSEKSDSFNGRLKTQAFALAHLDGRDSVDLILEILAFPSEWGGNGHVADTLEALLFNGALIKAEAGLKALDQPIRHTMQPGQAHDQSSRYLLQRCLTLLPFFDPPSAGIAKMKEIIDTAHLQAYDLREVLMALGHSQSNEALNLLLEISTKYGSQLQRMGNEWIDAIATLDTLEAKKVVMSFVDQDIPQVTGKPGLEYHELGRIVSRIASRARSDRAVKERIYALCETAVHPQARGILAEVVSFLGTSEALIAGLKLIRDRLNPAIPQELIAGLENAFLGKQPYASGYSYTIEPKSSDEIRKLLFTMSMGDESRKRSACLLLGQIESWRLEYGRPSNEPRHPDIDSGLPWPPLLDKEILLVKPSSA